MNFTDLYRFSNSLTSRAVPVEALRSEVVGRHPVIEAVEFWGCELDQSVSRGHMVLNLDRSSAYDGEFVVASIRYHSGLNTCWRRFVCCKELMHVFDSSLERVSNRDRFLTLMEQLESNPIFVNSSPMFKSERNAEWMALLVLCPQRLRDHYRAELRAGNLSELQVAEALRIPREYIRALLSSEYDRAFEYLTGEPI